MDVVVNMSNGRMISKAAWKKQVWEKAWQADRDEWEHEFINNRHLDLLKLYMLQPGYSIWWSISDFDRRYMRRCEVMVRIICHTSLLKGDDCRLRRATFAAKMCTLCDVGGVEDARHVIMQCQFHTNARTEMFNEIVNVYPAFGQEETFSILLGRVIDDVECNVMVSIWLIACTYISRMYWDVIKSR